jgi:hypothetical protein
MIHDQLSIKERVQQCPCIYSYLPVAATQCAQPAAASTMEASVGRGKASGVSLTRKIEGKKLFVSSTTCKINQHIWNEVEVFYGAALPHASRM